MRVEAARRFVAIAALTWCTVSRAALGAAPSAAPGDSGAVAPTARDTAAVATTARPTPAVPAAAPVPAPAPAAAQGIDVAAERKLGAASIGDILRIRRAVFIGALPFSGPTVGQVSLPDGGGPMRLDGFDRSIECSTDEPLIGSLALGWGAPWLAVALDDPRVEGIETLDLEALELPIDRAEFRGPGEALTRPVPKGPAFGQTRADTARSGLARTTLVYQRGGGNAQLSGVRFQTTASKRRLFASYSRTQANGWAPLKDSVSSRYALGAELGRIGGYRLDLDGLLFESTLRDSAGEPPETGGESQWDQRHLALGATREGERWSNSWQIRAGSEKSTWVMSSDLNLSPDAGSRERWEFPAIAARGSMTWRAAPSLTWIASAEAASRKLVYRVGPVPAFEPRRDDVRVHLGNRIALGAGAGVGFDAAYDARETQAGFWDARGSLWGTAGRARGRVDLESANERPSWVDLLTPPSLHTFVSAPGTPFVLSQLFRSGNPGLRPRRLSGAIGSAGITLFEGLDLEFSGSARRVTDDFGWNVSADTSGGSYNVSSAAVARGSGWLTHAACGWEFRRGPIRSRGVGWIRGGPDTLSPQSGSPPRRALDAGVELRMVFFQGDLPLRLGVESHARGPRRGLIREAAQVTWDGSLAADFGSAGVFLRVRDAFDRRPGSAIWDPAFPGGAPLPGRTFQAGIAWNLLD